jgi:regulatory protein
MEALNQEVLEKLWAWCSGQERCASELRRKLKRLLVPEERFEGYHDSLKKDAYMNEERFAEAFASGKSRIKQWGPMKIRSAMRMKGVPAPLIDKVLGELDETEMTATIDKLLEQKWPKIKANDEYDHKQKAIRFLAAKGYKISMAYAALERFQKVKND